MKMTAERAKVHEERAIAIVSRVTDYIEKWSRTEARIGRKPISLEKKSRALALARAALDAQNIVVSDILIDIIIESTCLANDHATGVVDFPDDDPTADDDDDDDEDDEGEDT